jgi:hypothetical protein
MTVFYKPKEIGLISIHENSTQVQNSRRLAGLLLAGLPGAIRPSPPGETASPRRSSHHLVGVPTRLFCTCSQVDGPLINAGAVGWSRFHTPTGKGKPLIFIGIRAAIACRPSALELVSAELPMTINDKVRGKTAIAANVNRPRIDLRRPRGDFRTKNSWGSMSALQDYPSITPGTPRSSQFV